MWRKIRGALAIGAVWAVPAAIVGMVGGGIASIVTGLPFLAAVVSGALTVGSVFGFLGTGFATVLAITERRNSFDQLSPRRGAAWGALGGAMVMLVQVAIFLRTGRIPVDDPDLVLSILTAVGIYAALGGALGLATIGVARQAPDSLPQPASAEALPRVSAD